MPFIKQLVHLLAFLLLAISLGTAWFGWWFITTTYGQALQVLIDLSGRTNDLAVWQSVLPLGMYQRVQFGAVLASLLAAVLSISLFVVRRQATIFISAWGAFVINCGRIFMVWTKLACSGWWGFVLLLLMAVRVALAVIYPFHIDSMYSYLFFVDRGVAAVLFWYPEPNNHILYNLLCWPLYIAGLPAEIVMRTPAWLCGGLQWIVLVGWLKSRLDKQNHLIICPVMAYVFLNYWQMYLGFTGRGYLLQSMLFVMCLPIIDRLQNQPKDRMTHLLLIMVVALGFYTIPTFLYAWICLWPVLILFVWRNNLALFLRHLVMTGSLVALLYLPVMIINGPEALLANKWVARLTFSEWLAGFGAYWLDWQNECWGFGIGSVLTLLLTAALIFLKSEQQQPLRTLKMLTLSVFWLPVWLIAWQGVLPPSRIWTWQIVGIALGLFYILATITEKLKTATSKSNFQIAAWALALLFAIRSVWIFADVIQTGFGPYDSVEKQMMPLLSRYQPPNVFVQDVDGIITLNLKLQARKSSSDWKPDIDIFWQENKTYQAIILRKDSGPPATFENAGRYRLTFADGYYEIWMLI